MGNIGRCSLRCRQEESSQGPPQKHSLESIYLGAKLWGFSCSGVFVLLYTSDAICILISEFFVRQGSASDFH